MRVPAGAETWSASLPPDAVLFGRTEPMRELRSRLEKVAPTDVPVLIEGASGTGKEVVARWLHMQSLRRGRVFVKVHCPAIPAPLLESDLFGHEEGAFTGALRAKPGRFEDADGGTLFLDEISELDHALQAKLLQILQDGRVCRVGGSEERALDVRVLCASHSDLLQEARAGRFRPDLLYRINVVRVELPTLAERKADILDLAAYFLELFCRKYRQAVPPLSPAAGKLLLAHDWPGNVRELENIVNRYVIFGSEENLVADLLDGDAQAAPRRPEESLSLRRIARQAGLEAQRRVILEVLHAQHWNRRQTARVLHISYRALLYKLRDTGIPSRKSMQTWPGKPSLHAS